MLTWNLAEFRIHVLEALSVSEPAAGDLSRTRGALLWRVESCSGKMLTSQPHPPVPVGVTLSRNRVTAEGQADVGSLGWALTPHDRVVIGRGRLVWGQT